MLNKTTADAPVCVCIVPVCVYVLAYLSISHFHVLLLKFK
jgi:hypothetical protein